MEKVKKFLGIKTKFKENVTTNLKSLASEGDTALKNDKGRFGFNIVTEKSVYQPGEKVCISVFCYEKWTKKPVQKKQTTALKLATKLSVQLFDSSETKIRDLVISTGKCESIFEAEFQTGVHFKGGFYSVSAVLDEKIQDSTRFFVTSVREKRNAVTIDLNKDALKAGDQVVGKVVLKMLTRTDDFLAEGSAFYVLKYGLKVTTDTGTILHTESFEMEGGEGYFTYGVSEELKAIESLNFGIEVSIEGEQLRTSRQLEITSFDEMQVKFVPNAGKFVLGLENRVFFSCFTDSEEKIGTQLERGEIVSLPKDGKLESQEYAVELNGIASDDSGRGSFKIILEKSKQFFLRIRKKETTRLFPLYTDDDLGKNYERKFCKVRLTTDRRVYSRGEKMEVKLTKSKGMMAQKFILVLGDKIKTKYVTHIQMDKQSDTFTKPVELKKIKDLSGGVYTFQLYKVSQEEMPLQEILIYVEPSNKLKLGLTFDKKVYCPGDEVKFTVNAGSKSVVGVSVSDETAFLEIERRRRPVSFATKTFLEKEVYSASGELADSSQYVDWFFENNPEVRRGLLEDSGDDVGQALANLQSRRRDKLELLLGVQGWRSLFLSTEKIKEYCKKNTENEKLNRALEYIIPLSGSSMKTKLIPASICSELRFEFEEDFDMLCGGNPITHFINLIKC